MCKLKGFSNQTPHGRAIADHQSYVSPRRRALQTVKLLDLGVNERLPWNSLLSETSLAGGNCSGAGSIEISEDLEEWDYGEYEGMTISEVWERRRQQGLNVDGRPWNIFQDGCDGGE